MITNIALDLLLQYHYIQYLPGAPTTCLLLSLPYLHVDVFMVTTLLPEQTPQHIHCNVCFNRPARFKTSEFSPRKHLFKSKKRPHTGSHLSINGGRNIVICSKRTHAVVLFFMGFFCNIYATLFLILQYDPQHAASNEHKIKGCKNTRCRYENKYEVSKYKYESHKISSQYKYIYNYYKLLNPKLITHHYFECSVRLEKAQYKCNYVTRRN